jgi:3-dehydroquinate dehydratase I
MICVAISDRSLEKCLKTLDDCEMAEIRLDLTGFNEDEIRQVFTHKTPTIATCRPEKKGTEDQLKKLKLAIETGARYVDIEYEADKRQKDALIEIAHQHNCRVIISYHNFFETPSSDELFKIADTAYKQGADIVKIATMTNQTSDNARLFSLYSLNKPLVGLGMGEIGKITRIMAPFLGAEFTFASMDDGSATAPGQITYNRMKQLVNQLKIELMS